MIIILDASTLINLVNGGVLSHAFRLPGVRFLISEMVVDEARTIAGVVNEAVAAGLLELVDGDMITMSAFTRAKNEMNLGDGETECILAAELVPSDFACDDWTARTFARNRLGHSRVTGSIGLLQQAVKASILLPEDASAAYKLMIACGGYLPRLEDDHFEAFATSNGLGTETQ